MENKYLKDIEDLEEKRLDAFSGRNALEYMTLCNKLGLEPEDTDLYDQGMAESIFQKDKKSGLEEKLKITNELNFIEESKCINNADWSADTDIKKELMGEYFPESFGPGEKQDIKPYQPGAVGKIFSELVKYYTNKYQKN